MNLPRGVQTPRVHVAPRGRWRGDGEDAVFLSASYGLPPDEWQELVLADWLARSGRGGRFASLTCGLSVPRQNGKNAVIEMRELFGMVSLGERFLHTAHEVKTARKAFLRLASFFENSRKYPELAELVQDVRRTNGQEAILLTNGGGVEFVARSKGSGRGFTVDVLVCDEAQELSDDALEALMPTTSAAPQGNPQWIFTGTPPGPTANGEVFTRTRDDALSGQSRRLCWHEWSCLGAVDLDDPLMAASANPALGGRLHWDVVQGERARFSDEGYARERLGMWSSAASHRVISADSWSIVADSNLRDGGREVAVALDVSPDRSTATLASASWTVDGLPYVDVVESRRGEPDWGIQRFVDLCERHDVRAVVVDGASAAFSLVDPLRQRGITVTVTTARQMAAAFGGFYDAVMDGKVRHLDQPPLNAALASARKRSIGDSGFGWSRKDSESDITPVTAATLALWGLTSSEVEERPRVRSGKACFV
jgi:phage terminase large subunit-like protein